MRDPVGLKVNGLKCDAPGCDYIDREEYGDYAACVGMPCPKCGASLLTQEDLETMSFLRSVVTLLNDCHSPVPDDAACVLIPLVMDGSGSITMAQPIPETDTKSAVRETQGMDG